MRYFYDVIAWAIMAGLFLISMMAFAEVFATWGTK